jgi:nickel/cobalt exporter
MPDIANLIQQGSSNLWIFIPSAILLGALHGLEPGHSKTMMAAFIVAIRGTVGQAILLGLAATISHTAIVWIIALAGLHFGSQWNVETTEPYLQVVSAIMIFAVAIWMMTRTWRHQHAHQSHSHEDEKKIIDTGHGIVMLEVFEDGVPPRFRLHAKTAGALSHYSASEITIETKRPDGSTQQFLFIKHGDYFESLEEIPEPHEFKVRLNISHGNHNHAYDVEYTEHDHTHAPMEGLDVGGSGYQDLHELAHANDIRHRFANQHVTTGQIIFFGLTGGLIPCPASITILLLCLQLKKVVLGSLLVLCFSIGLALTMVLSGTLAALSVRHVSRRFSGFGKWANKAPYISGTLIILIGLYIGYSGLAALL